MATNNKDKPKKELNPFIKYMGMGTQMGVTIYLGSWLGEWLDEKYHNPDGLYTKIATLVAVFLSITHVIVQVSRDSNR